MDESLTVDINNLELIDTVSVADPLTTLVENFCEILEPLIDVVRELAYRARKMFQNFIQSINSIDFSSIINLYPTLIAGIIEPSIALETPQYQLPEKIIDDEPNLFLSYSVFYNSDYLLCNETTNSSESDCSKNDIKSTKKTIPQKIHDSLSFEFLTQTIASIFIGWFFEYIRFLFTNNFDIQSSMIISFFIATLLNSAKRN